MIPAGDCIGKIGCDRAGNPVNVLVFCDCLQWKCCDLHDIMSELNYSVPQHSFKFLNLYIINIMTGQLLFGGG